MSAPINSNTREFAQAILNVLERGAAASIVTVVRAPQNVGRKLLIEESGAVFGTLSKQFLDDLARGFSDDFLSSQMEASLHKVSRLGTVEAGWEDAELLFERIEPEPKVVICGAGHVGSALAQVAAIARYRTSLIDDRAAFLTSERFPNKDIELIVALEWERAVADAVGRGRGVSICVVTRGHNEDERCLRAAVACSPDYAGLIGSRRRTNIVLQRLLASGVDTAVVSKIHAPIGLDIGAVTPEEVAIAIFSEIVAVRRGGKSGSLSAWRREPTIKSG